MMGTLLLLHEQCEPLDEFMAIIKCTQSEIENQRATQFMGRGYLTQDIAVNHGYILEELLYPIIDKCNPNSLYMVVKPFHVEIILN